MADTLTAVAESSTAILQHETIELPKSGTSDYAEWRMSGTIPEKEAPKPKADPAPAPKENAETSGDPAAPKPQEHTRRRPDAEARIKELAAESKRLRAELDALKAPKPEPTKPVQQQAQYTRPKPTTEDKQDGKPKYTTYDEFVEDLSDWKAEQRIVAQAREQEQKAQTKALQDELAKARTRYENFDDVLTPTLNAIVSDNAVSPAVKAMLNDSEVLPDLIFTIGSDAKDLASFLQMAKTNPGKALRYIARVEGLIEEELSKGTIAAERDATGKFASKPEPAAPAKRGPESAPEPPLEIGSRGAGPMDESGRALSAIERGDPNAVRAWIRAENAKDLRRRRGVA